MIYRREYNTLIIHREDEEEDKKNIKLIWTPPFYFFFYFYQKQSSKRTESLINPCMDFSTSSIHCLHSAEKTTGNFMTCMHDCFSKFLSFSNSFPPLNSLSTSCSCRCSSSNMVFIYIYIY